MVNMVPYFRSSQTDREISILMEWSWSKDASRLLTDCWGVMTSFSSMMVMFKSLKLSFVSDALQVMRTHLVFESLILSWFWWEAQAAFNDMLYQVVQQQCIGMSLIHYSSIALWNFSINFDGTCILFAIWYILFTYFYDLWPQHHLFRWSSVIVTIAEWS